VQDIEIKMSFLYFIVAVWGLQSRDPESRPFSPTPNPGIDGCSVPVFRDNKNAFYFQSQMTFPRLTVDVKFSINIRIHVYGFVVDIHGYIHIHSRLSYVHLAVNVHLAAEFYKI